MDSRSIRVLQLTDMHLFADPKATLLGMNTQDSFEAVLDLARHNLNDPDVLLLTGDLSHDGSKKSYQRLAEAIKVFNCPAYWVPGNHDDVDSISEYFKGVYIGRDKCITIGDWRIILLNTARSGEVAGFLDGEQLKDLSECLKVGQEKHNLICLHHHPISIGSKWLDELGLQSAIEFFSTIKQHKCVKSVLCGHIHQILDKEIDGVRYIASPSTCIQFLPGSEAFALDHLAPGYRVLELNDTGIITSEVYRVYNFDVDLHFDKTGYE